MLKIIKSPIPNLPSKNEPLNIVVISSFIRSPTSWIIPDAITTIFKNFVPSKHLSTTQNFITEHFDQFTIRFFNRIVDFYAKCFRIPLFNIKSFYIRYIPYKLSKTQYNWGTNKCAKVTSTCIDRRRMVD